MGDHKFEKRFGKIDRYTPIARPLPARKPAPAEDRTNRRHAAITDDLSKLPNYEEWTHRIRDSWK